MAVKDGRVAEVGTHDELMKTRGLYHSLVTAQMAEDDDEEREMEDTVADLEDGQYIAHTCGCDIPMGIP